MTKKIASTPDAWEDGPLGKDLKHAQAIRQTAEEEALIDAALGLKAISIRLESELVDQFKMIAKHYGMGYQPLMRQALHRFVEGELKLIALSAISKSEECHEVLISPAHEPSFEFVVEQKKVA